MRRAAAVLATLLGAAGLLAQETPAPAGPPAPAPRQARDGRHLLYPNIGIIQVDLAEGTLALVDNVTVQIGDIHLRCDTLIAWLADRKDEAPARPPGRPEAPSFLPPGSASAITQASQLVKEIYAEGTVLYSHGDEFARADRLFLDLVNDRGVIIDSTFSLPLAGRKSYVKLSVKADELRILAQDHLQGSGVRLSTCTFGHPHYHLEAAFIDAIKDPPGPPESARPGAPPVQNYHVEVKDAVLRAGSLPVFWVPGFVGDSAQRGLFRYVEDVRLRNSNRFGLEAGLTVGDDLEDEKGVFAHWSVPVDYYSKRGVGAGVDFVYGDPERSARGRFTARYQRDVGEDEFFGEPPTRNRGRIQWEHRQKLPWELELDVELALLSDRGYYPTFFENEDKGRKPPENLAFLKRRFFNSYWGLLYTTRVNDWETVVEYEPELRYDLVYEPLFDVFGRPLYLNGTARVSKTRLEVDEDLDVRPRGTWRTDLDTLLELPFPVGPFTLTPFAGPRWTWYQEDRFERRGRDRLGLTFGATLSTQAWRIYDALGGLFGLDGLRHVVYPEVTFRDTVGVRLHPDELIPFDEVDGYDNVQVVELRMRNLFQTIRHRDTGPTVDNIIDLDAAIDWYPNAGHDHFDEPWSNLDLDLIVRFSDDLQIAADAEYDPYGGGFEVANAAFGYTPSRELQLYGGFRHFRDTYDAAFFQANWRVDEKWMLTLETAYDFFEDRGLDHRFSLTRVAHDWVMQIGLRADVGENDYEISFSIEPRLFWDSTLQPRSLRSEPRLLYLGSGLTN